MPGIEDATLQLELALQIVRDLPDAIFVVDTSAEARIVMANRRALFLSGYAEADILGQSIDLLVPKALREQHTGHRTDYILDPQIRPMGITQELHMIRSDGRAVEVEIQLGPINVRSQNFVVAVVRRKR